MAEEESTDDTGPCVFCGARCTEDEYCIGCGNFVCDECDTQSAWEHTLTDHTQRGSS